MQRIYQVDAFTQHLFSGNPAAVCPLSQWLDDSVLQNIAQENNLAETAYIVDTNSAYEIRWFTPTTEVDLCGHATLAAAYVLFFEEGYTGDVINFISPRSGQLSVLRKGNLLTLDFPVDELVPVEVDDSLKAPFEIAPVEVYKGRSDYLLIYESEAQILALAPDLRKLSRINARGVIVSAPGTRVDFVSRFFAPQSGVDEDPVTGSAHTLLTPFWAARLRKNLLTAQQLSTRKGWLECKLVGSRVEISGYARLYLKGEIHTA